MIFLGVDLLQGRVGVFIPVGVLALSVPVLWCLSLVLENCQSLLLQVFLLLHFHFFSFWYSNYVCDTFWNFPTVIGCSVLSYASFHLVIRRLLWSFGDVIFLDSSCSLEFYIAVFTSFDLYQQPSGDILFVGPACILRLSLTLYGYTCSMLLAPSCGRIFKLVCRLSNLKCTRPAIGNLFFFFPSGGTTAHNCGFSLPHTPCSVFCVYSLSI